IGLLHDQHDRHRPDVSIRAAKRGRLAALLGSLCLVAAADAQTQKAAGPVSVLYAGSLGALMDRGLAPAIERATGYRVHGEGPGSVAAARMIRDRLRTPDVFVSADPAVYLSILMGAKNGDLVDWYVAFAAAELVIGYNPKSRFREDFELAREGKVPWYQVL